MENNGTERTELQSFLRYGMISISSSTVLVVWAEYMTQIGVYWLQNALVTFFKEQGQFPNQNIILNDQLRSNGAGFPEGSQGTRTGSWASEELQNWVQVRSTLGRKGNQNPRYWFYEVSNSVLCIRDICQSGGFCLTPELLDNRIWGSVVKKVKDKHWTMVWKMENGKSFGLNSLVWSRAI